MRRLLSPLLVVTLGYLAATGCAATTAEVAGEDGAVGVAEQAAGVGDPPSGQNGKHGSCMWPLTTLQAYHTLAGLALNQGGNELPSVTGILPGCRDEVLANAVECALRPDQAVVDPVTHAKYTGWWGLASGWFDEPLDADGRRWVTACMIQRLNFFGAVVPILIEGAHPAILPDPTLEPYYPFFESVAYGDIFSSPTNVPVNVCYNDDLAKLCDGTGLSPSLWLNLRICDSTPGCGLTVMGPCSKVCEQTGTTSAHLSCERPDGTYDDHTAQVHLEAQKSCSTKPAE